MQPLQGTKYKSFQNDTTLSASLGQITSELLLQNATIECKGASFVDFSLDTLLVDTINEKTTDHGVEVDGVLIKDGTVSTSSAVVPRISNLTSNGFVKTSGGDGTLFIDTSTYENPLTFSSPLIRTINTISLDTKLNISQILNLTTAGFVKTDASGILSIDTSTYITAAAIAGKLNRSGDYMAGPLDFKGYSATDVKLGSLTTNGFVKTSSLDGTLTVDTNTYITSNQTITLSGDISGSGTTAITTTIGASKVLNSMLFGGITAAKLVGTDIDTLGTIGTGTWQGTTIGTLYGGTGNTSYTSGQLLIGNASNTLTKATLTGTSNQLTVTNGSGSITLSIPTDLRVNDLRIRNVADPTYYSTITTNGAGQLLISAGFGAGGSNSITSDGFRFLLNGGTTNTIIAATNPSTGSASFISTVNVGSGDPQSQYIVDATQTWTTGIDQSASNAFKISSSSALGTSDRLSITTAGVVNVPNLSVSSLVATDASRNLTSTVSGISPGFTNMTLSGALTMSGTGASRLVFANTTAQNRIVELFRTANNDHQYLGFGVNASTLRYQVAASTDNHVFFAGASAAASTELMRVLGTGRVGIGTTAPDKTLEINAAAGGSLRLTYNDSNGTATNYSDFSVDAAGNLSIAPSGSYILPATNNTIALGSSSFRFNTLFSTSGIFYTGASFGDGSVSAPGIAFASDSNTGLYRIGAENIGITCNATKLIDILGAGITMPIQPSFNVYPSANISNVTGDSTQYTVVFNTENHDAGSNFSSTTFTAPVAGRYELTCVIQVVGMTASHTAGFITFVVGGSGLATVNTNPNSLRNSSSGTATMSLHTILQLAASDALTVVLTVGSSTKTISVVGGRANTYFCGQLLS